jgi:modulator of FtsH protease HflK
MRRLAAALVVGAIAYAATGLAVVAQDEVGVVRRFGAVLAEPWGPGLHWGLPWGIDRIDRIKVGQTRTLVVGARGPEGAPLAGAPDPEADEVLTGDLNLVTAQAALQYRVADPVKFLFRARSAEAALAAATESALTRAAGARGVDDVLTTGRAEVAEAMARAIQEQADRLGLGVSVRAVRLGRGAPPAPGAPAFADAARARSDLRQAVTRAEEYRDRAAADARGQAREIADRAAAAHDRAVQVARGEADRFAKVLAEARKDPAATRRRLYLEALAELLPRFRRTVVVPPGKAIDLSLFADDAPREGPAAEPRPAP